MCRGVSTVRCLCVEVCPLYGAYVERCVHRTVLMWRGVSTVQCLCIEVCPPYSAYVYDFNVNMLSQLKSKSTGSMTSAKESNSGEKQSDRSADVRCIHISPCEYFLSPSPNLLSCRWY